MNIGDIAERLIEAAEIEEAAHRSRVGPAQAKSMSLPYAHTWADMNGWGAERLKEEEKAFQQSIARTPTAQQISEAEEAVRWYAFVRDGDQREALAGWVGCMAGRSYFKDWCFKHGIHPETGRRRKDRALARISAHLGGCTVQDCTNEDEEVLLDPRDLAYLKATFGKQRADEPVILSWRSDPSLKPQSDPEQQDFSWAEKRNRRRREQAAKRQDAA